MAGRKVLVKCEFEIEVEFDEERYGKLDDYDILFRIEENSCPGTNIVGSTLDQHIQKFEDNGYCWACALKGSNTVLAIDGVPPKR